MRRDRARPGLVAPLSALRYRRCMIEVRDHPLLDLVAVALRWPAPLGTLAAPPELQRAIDAPDPALPPLPDTARGLVRDLLRHGGFKPSGRSKPCSEYIASVASRGDFPRINVAVDLTNALVLRGGLPISTVDLDRLQAPLSVGLAGAGERYVFNASGQEIDLGGLLCLFDVAGPCANAVKDAQRAKTDGATRHTLTLIWGTVALPNRAHRVAERVRELAAQAGAQVLSGVL